MGASGAKRSMLRWQSRSSSKHADAVSGVDVRRNRCKGVLSIRGLSTCYLAVFTPAVLALGRGFDCVPSTCDQFGGRLPAGLFRGARPGEVAWSRAVAMAASRGRARSMLPLTIWMPPSHGGLRKQAISHCWAIITIDCGASTACANVLLGAPAMISCSFALVPILPTYRYSWLSSVK